MSKKWYLSMLALTLLSAACSDDEPSTVSDGSPSTVSDGSVVGLDAGAPDGSLDLDAQVATGDAGCLTPFARVQVVPFDPEGDGDPASLYWNDRDRYLLIADQRGNRVWKWTDAEGLKLLGKTSGKPADPADAGRDNVGQIVELDDGLVVVTRFGFGTHGGILWLRPDGTSGEVPGIDPTRRRVSLVATDAGLFSGYFTPSDAGVVGAVSKVSLDAGEQDYAVGFRKPLGMLPVGNDLIVVDQEREVPGQSPGVLVKLPLRSPPDAGTSSPGLPSSYPSAGRVPSGDQLAYGPNGTLFTGQFRPLPGNDALEIRQICSDGSYRTFDTKLTKPSGIAYDPSGRRLFVADSNGTLVRTLRIYTIP